MHAININWNAAYEIKARTIFREARSFKKINNKDKLNIRNHLQLRHLIKQILYHFLSNAVERARTKR